MGELDNDNSNYPEHTKKGEDLIPYFWCEDNGVEIKPQYHYKDGINEWKIKITIGSKVNTDPNIYEKKDIMNKIYEYCNYYYNNYKV